MDRIILFLISILILTLPFAQKSKAQDFECATDFIHEQRMKTDSSYRKNFHLLQSQVQAALSDISLERNEAVVYRIPVVVHVIHKGEPVGTGSNISDAQIRGAIAGLNNRWRNLMGSGVDVEMEFCLASVDPAGHATSGINRVDGSVIPRYAAHGIGYLYSNCEAPARDSVEDLSKWPVNAYYNIWVVHQICQGFGNIAGFANYPQGDPHDGTVIRAYYMDTSDATLTHELGHAFFLYHSFEQSGGTTCPTNVNCAVEGDFICDTPPHKQNDCGATNPCSTTGVWDNSRYNYMSYCGIKNRFTQDQKNRIRATAIVSPRSTLLTSTGCAIVGINETRIENPFSFFPNPAHENFMLLLNSEIKNGRVEIYNLCGVKVYSATILSKQQIIPTKFTAGIYYLRVSNDEVQLTRKLIIE